MALPVITDTLRVAVEGHEANGHHWANVLHFRKTPIITFVAAIAIIDTPLFAVWNTAAAGGDALKNFAPTASGLDDFRFTPLDGTTATTVNSHILAGTNAGDPMPASCAMCITLRTGLRGRSHRGRTYVGPFVEAANATIGAPVAAQLVMVLNQYVQLMSALVGSGVSLVVASYAHSTAENVTSLTIDSRWTTQRRRLLN